MLILSVDCPHWSVSFQPEVQPKPHGSSLSLLYRPIFLCVQPSFSMSPPPSVPTGASTASKRSGLPPAMEPLVKCSAAAATWWPWGKLSVNKAAGLGNSPRTGQHRSGCLVIIYNHCASFNLSPAIQAIHTHQKCELLFSTHCVFFFFLNQNYSKLRRIERIQQLIHFVTSLKGQQHWNIHILEDDPIHLNPNVPYDAKFGFAVINNP